MILGVITIVLLLLLGTRYLAGASESASAQHIAKTLTLPAVALVAAFVVLVALRAAEIVSY